MSRPPTLTGDPRVDRALLSLARLLMEIAAGHQGDMATGTDAPHADPQVSELRQAAAPTPLRQVNSSADRAA